jgi:hypothetical protein
MDFDEIVHDLRNPVDYLDLINKESCILRKCILCKKYLSSNTWSLLLEKYIKNLFNLKDPESRISGDAKSSLGLNIEIKVSLGDSQSNLNFVQLRPDHHLDYYLLLAFNVHESSHGKLYWMLCDPERLYKLLPEYGNYAHGTTRILGKITEENVYDRNCEFSLRPNPLKEDHIKSKKLWKELLKFQVSVEEIKEILK